MEVVEGSGSARDQMYSRIIRALDALDILQYKDNFVAHELHDSHVEDCILDGTFVNVLKEVIPVLGQRLNFKKSFLGLNDPNVMGESGLVRQPIQDKSQHDRQSNQAHSSEAEKLLNDEISVLIENYSIDMNSEINSQIISDEELERIHSSISEKCLENFAKSHSSSLLYEQGRESLVKQISSVRDNLQKLVRAAYDNANKEGEAVGCQC